MRLDCVILLFVHWNLSGYNLHAPFSWFGIVSSSTCAHESVSAYLILSRFANHILSPYVEASGDLDCKTVKTQREYLAELNGLPQCIISLKLSICEKLRSDMPVYTPHLTLAG